VIKDVECTDTAQQALGRKIPCAHFLFPVDYRGWCSHLLLLLSERCILLEVWILTNAEPKAWRSFITSLALNWHYLLATTSMEGGDVSNHLHYIGHLCYSSKIQRANTVACIFENAEHAP